MTRNKYFKPAINVDKVWSLVTEETRTYYAKNTEKAPVIDCVQAVSQHLYLMGHIFYRARALSITSGGIFIHTQNIKDRNTLTTQTSYPSRTITHLKELSTSKATSN